MKKIQPSPFARSLAACLLASLPLSLGCRREEAPGATAAPSAAPRPAPSASVAGEMPPPEPSTPEPGPDGWVEVSMYKLKSDGFAACTPKEKLAHGARRVAARVHVSPKVNQFFVTGRDFELLSEDGVILSSSPLPPAEQGCAAPLPAKMVDAGKRNSGSVAFDVPEGFNPKGGDLQLVYKPTRWAGAPRAPVKVPACLEACDDTATKPAR